MDTRDGPSSAAVAVLPQPGVRHGRMAWHAIAVLAAAALAWLVFSAYRQPDLILNLADLRLC